MKIQRTCQACGVAYQTWPAHKLFFCSNKCYIGQRFGDRASNWRSGKVIVSKYRYVYSPDHENATKDGYVLEHRLVMEAVIKRLLTKQEVVHHINGDRLDNRIENLVICKSSGTHMADYHITRDKKNGRFLPLD